MNIAYETTYSNQYHDKLKAQEEFLRLVEQIAPSMKFMGHDNKSVTFGGRAYASYFFDGITGYSKISMANWDKQSWTVSLEVGITQIYHECKVPGWIRKLFNDGV